MDESELFAIILLFFIAFVFMKMITCDRFIEGFRFKRSCDDHNSCPDSQFCGSEGDPDKDSGYCYTCDKFYNTATPLTSKTCQLTDDGDNVIYNQNLIQKCPKLKDKVKELNANEYNTSEESEYGNCCIDDDCADGYKCSQNVDHWLSGWTWSGGSCEINCCYGARDFVSANKRFGGKGLDGICKGKKPFEIIMDSKQPERNCSVSDLCPDKPSQIVCGLYHHPRGRKFSDYLVSIFGDEEVQSVLHEIGHKMGSDVGVEYDGKEKPSIYGVMKGILYERRPETAEQDLQSFKTMYDNLDKLDEPTETPMPTLQN